MAVCLADVGRRGRVDIHIAARSGNTVISSAYCEAPYKITRLHEARTAGMAHLILMQCTPGIFGGDDLECSITVESGAQLLITQQSATKVHPSGGRLATVKNCIRVETGAELHFLNDPIIPFAASRFHQTTTIDVETGARLIYWESLMAGRIGRSELWQFEELHSETRLIMGGTLLYLDRFRLTPAKMHIDTPWTLCGAAYVATGLCFQQQVASLAERLHAALPAAGVDTPAAELAVIRVAASTGPELHSCRETFGSLSLEK
jgi:urease accessory protein